MRYLFAGGGTGGHIFPAIAIADELRKRDDKAEILFVGAKGRIEEKIVPSNNYRLETIAISGFDRSSLLKNIGLPVKLLKALKKCASIISSFSPDVAVGTGGFVCGPVIFQASRAGIPTLIQEGNAYAGKTVSFLAPRCDKVVINFKETERYLKRKDNIVRLAHPIRSSLKRIERSDALKIFGLGKAEKVLFVFGGSQGARGINDCMKSAMPELLDSGVSVIWQTGSSDYQAIKQFAKGHENEVRVFEFIDRMDAAYSACDAAVCRAGITSIMEIAYLGVPAILIPLPGSAEDHQVINSRTYSGLGAAKFMLQSEAVSGLGREAVLLLCDKAELQRQKEAGETFADPEAARKIAELVLKLAGRK